MNRIACAALLLLIIPGWSNADASLYVAPERGVYAIGETFDVQVFADSGGESINAAEAELDFDPEVLSVENISTEGSILSQWPTLPTHSNETGAVKFSGWTKEAYVGKGLLITITFRALRNSISNAHLAAGAMLAADGRGSNIITSMKSGAYRIEPKQVEAEIPEETVPARDEMVVEVYDVPPAPVVEYDREIAVGEHVVVRGVTFPNVKVFVWLKHGDEPESRIELASKEDGAFTFVSGEEAQAGVYRFFVQAQNEIGERGPATDRMTIIVRPSGLAAVAVSSVELVSTVLPLILLLIVGGLGVGYLFHRHAVERMRHERQ